MKKNYSNKNEESEVKILNEVNMGVFGAEHLTEHDVDPKTKEPSE